MSFESIENKNNKEEKRYSDVSRVVTVGLDKKEEERLLKEFRSEFEDTKDFSFERKKTSEEKETIGNILKSLPSFVEKYEGKFPDNFTLEHVHLVDETKITDQERKEMNLVGHQGVSVGSDGVAIIARENILDTALAVSHELLHQASFSSILQKEISEEEVMLVEIRQGFRINTVPKGLTDETFEQYFDDFDEAMISELVKRYDKEYFSSIPMLNKSIAEREYARKQLNDDDEEISWAVRFENNGRKLIRKTEHPYSKERKKLNDLISDLYLKNKENFASREEVFDLFARTVFTGKLLKVARLVEKTYGKGSFRKLAEDTGKTRKLKLEEESED